jgi:formate hydrogenlyase subunit 3/multisubunit Na+/H+ antiporter MnhD subunit
MIAVILLAAALGILFVAAVAARYLSWFGAAVPAGIVYALGVAWEWDPEAGIFIIAAGLVGVLGFIVGLWRRRTERRRVREGLV